VRVGADTVAEIDVHRQSRTIDLYWHGAHVWHGIVAIGAPGMETPLGHYFVPARFVPYNDPFLRVFGVERLLAAHGMAGRRLVRDPWHGHAAAARRGRLAWVYSRLEPDGDEASPVRAARHVDRDHGYVTASDPV
jgi:hypothetical protein